MEPSKFDETEFFRAIAASQARAILIGRRALVVLGLPVLTRDYDFWIHADDMEVFNAALSRFDLFANRSPQEARSVGRYVLQNDEQVDVLLARAVFTVDNVKVAFDELWERRQLVSLTSGVEIVIPSLDDLILTKRFAARPKDAEDIRMIPRVHPPSAETLRRIYDIHERRLTAEEFHAYVNAPMSESEREEILASIKWFTKRYPTAAERLAATRRLYQQWSRSLPR